MSTYDTSEWEGDKEKGIISTGETSDESWLSEDKDKVP